MILLVKEISIRVKQHLLNVSDVQRFVYEVSKKIHSFTIYLLSAYYLCLVTVDNNLFLFIIIILI